MNKVGLSANKKRIIGVVSVPILIAIGNWFFQKNGNSIIQNTAGSGSQSPNQVVDSFKNINTSGGSIIYNPSGIIITESKTKLDEELQQDIEYNRGKINTFFKHWNARLYKDARNNIGPRISRIFPADKMNSFKNNMTDLFRIKSSDLTDDEYAISESYVATKHKIIINYGYDGQYYDDDVFVIVERSIEDKRQHHITDIHCVDSTIKSPLCNFFR